MLLAPSSAALIAWLLSFCTRAAVTIATRENPLAIPLHPLTVLVGLAVPWTALARRSLGCPAGWKGRLYPGE